MSTDFEQASRCGAVEREPVLGPVPAGPCILDRGHLERDHAGFHQDAAGSAWRDARYVYAPGTDQPIGIEINGYPDTVDVVSARGI